MGVLRLAVITLLAAQLYGCGFHLRGYSQDESGTGANYAPITVQHSHNDNAVRRLVDQHLTAHALMKAALFMAIGGVTLSVTGLRLSDFNGAGRTAAWTMTPFAIASFSLLGVPLTMGFLTKWRLIEAMLGDAYYWAVAVIAISSILSLFYVGRMLEVLFFQPAQTGKNRIREAPLGALIPLWVLTVATIWFGIDGRMVEFIADSAATAVLGGVE